jgi:hypothetical protein
LPSFDCDGWRFSKARYSLLSELTRNPLTGSSVVSRVVRQSVWPIGP